RAADVLEAMNPDDAADLLGEFSERDAESFLEKMNPEDSAPVRRLLTFDADTAGGLMAPAPVSLSPPPPVAQAPAPIPHTAPLSAPPRPRVGRRTPAVPTSP